MSNSASILQGDDLARRRPGDQKTVKIGPNRSEFRLLPPERNNATWMPIGGNYAKIVKQLSSGCGGGASKNSQATPNDNLQRIMEFTSRVDSAVSYST
jgi:hypothetical protein